jgi:2-polyprenyl-3-methyl-5-hydroxy-6-metoxy-1,4-benzoquinol methylase
MYTKKEFNTNINEFFLILEKNKFKKEDFLFNAKPYIEGFFHIIKKTEIICKTNQKQKCKILDFGCGSGLTSYLLAKRGYNVQGIDIYDKNQEIQDIFRKKGKKSQKALWDNLCLNGRTLKINFFDGKKIPYDTNKFNIIFAHAVIEHIPSNILNDVLKEFNRTIKKNGYLIISRTPNKYSLTEFIAPSHEIKFSKQEICQLLENHKFNIIYYQKTDFFPQNGMKSKNLQTIINFLSPITSILDNLISNTLIEKYSHHHFIIAQKV